jgi:hypothetical protein
LRVDFSDQPPLEKVIRPKSGRIENVEISDSSALIVFISRMLFTREADEDNIEALTAFIEGRFSSTQIAAAARELRT